MSRIGRIFGNERGAIQFGLATNFRPTKGLDENISTASVKIAGHLEKLLEGEDQVEVNGEVIPLTPSGQQKLIANKQVKLIAEKNPK